MSENYQLDPNRRTPSVSPHKVYPPRSCRDCSAEFIPRSHNSARCDACRGGKAQTATFRIDRPCCGIVPHRKFKFPRYVIVELPVVDRSAEYRCKCSDVVWNVTRESAMEQMRQGVPANCGKTIPEGTHVCVCPCMGEIVKEQK